MDIAISKACIPIRLTDERWYHIVENHDDLLDITTRFCWPWRIRISSCAGTVAR
jgi:hypothetical protein